MSPTPTGSMFACISCASCTLRRLRCNIVWSIAGNTWEQAVNYIGQPAPDVYTSAGASNLFKPQAGKTWFQSGTVRVASAAGEDLPATLPLLTG